MEKENPNPHSDLPTLRQRAEGKLQQEAKISPLSDEKKSDLIHELRTHQIELEMLICE